MVVGLAQFPIDGKTDLRCQDRVDYIGGNKEFESEQEIVAQSVAKHFPFIERIVSPQTSAFDFYKCEQSDTDAPKDHGDTDNPDDQTDVLEEIHTTC
jgi:hypothetical protein